MFRKINEPTHGHNLNFYVGLLKSFFCPPALIRKIKFITAKNITDIAVNILHTGII